MGATFPRLKIWTAEKLTFDDLNNEIDNIHTNFKPSGMDDMSQDVSAMQTDRDPYPGGVPSLPIDLKEEIQGLRYLIKQITGQSYWYIDPTTSIAALSSGAFSLVTKTSTYTPTSNDCILLVSAASGDVTINLPAASSVDNGKLYIIKKIDTSTNQVIIDANGSESIDNRYIKRLRSMYEFVGFASDQTNWYIIYRDNPRRILGYKSLYVANKTITSTSQLTITADALDVEDSYNDIHRLYSVNIPTIDITTSGANGLDTGAEAANTTYAIWVIWDAENDTTAGLLSTSFTSPTMPTGYNYKRLVGFVRNESTNFLSFRQYNNIINYMHPIGQTQCLTNGTSTSRTAIDVSKWAGSTDLCRHVRITWQAKKTVDEVTPRDVYIYPADSTLYNKKIAQLDYDSSSSGSAASSTARASGEFEIVLDDSLQFGYEISGTTDPNIYLNCWVSQAILDI